MSTAKEKERIKEREKYYAPPNIIHSKQNKTILFYMCLMLMPISFLRLSFTRVGLIEERKNYGGPFEWINNMKVVKFTHTHTLSHAYSKTQHIYGVMKTSHLIFWENLSFFSAQFSDHGPDQAVVAVVVWVAIQFNSTFSFFVAVCTHTLSLHWNTIEIIF